ncbi:MAG TPA: tripartite tricarboxylate transporter substrate-binding protein [Xanthobacteraceae bacterium]|nr:tripartite tricarboxylate transporter substrate-binding protein [Xanthobacteraceae bacterium]
MLTRGIAAFLVSLALAAVPAQADAVSDFYKGKTVTVIVGYGTGGGYDVFARLLARHLGKYIPGNPSVIVQNMPGAGSMRAVNALYNTAPKDGTAIGMFGRDMPLVAILGTNPGVQFDPRKFVWLGSSSDFSNDAYILLVRKDGPVQSIEDARRPDSQPITLGVTGEGSTGTDIPILLRDTLGFKFKLVSGYPDNGAIFLALERNEVNGRTVDLSSVTSLKPEWLKPDSNMRILVQLARATRHPMFPDVPTARELAKDEKARTLIELAEQSYILSRPFAAPPGVPEDRAKALQAAFMAVHKDPEYLADAAKIRVEVSPVNHEVVMQAINKIANAPPDLLDYLRKLHSDEKKGG